MLMTASLAVSKHMLHSKVARSRSRSPSPLLPPPLLLPPGPSRSLLLSPAGNPPLLAGPPSLEDRGSAAAIIFIVQVWKVTHRPNPHGPDSSNVSRESEATTSVTEAAAVALLNEDFRFR